MKIHTYSQPKPYNYQGNLATYFPNNSNIDSTLKEAMIWMADPKEFKDKSDCQIPISKLHNHLPINPELSPIEEINNVLIEGMGIRCFTIDDKRSENEKFMWKEYAVNNEGICLVFNPEKDQSFFSHEDVIRVEYVKEFEQLNLDSPIDDWNKESSNLIKTICYSFGIKKEEYRIENEIRVIKLLCNMEKLLDVRIKEKGVFLSIEEIKEEINLHLKNNRELRKHPFDKQALVEIRFGEKMYNENPKRFTEIKNILESNGYNHVICKKVVYNSADDSFTYEDC